MRGYVTTEIMAKRWGISNSRVSQLCTEGKLEGSKKMKGKWMIPEDTKQPIDYRVKGQIKKSSFTFIDLFAGIGGFHQAMGSLGGKCVMASEIDENCVRTYKKNFRVEGNRIWGDINKINPNDIPEFDMLCAGFPCQPFSKAGLQKGFDDGNRGNLFFAILNILDSHPEVKFILLENVRNLADKTQNWEIITSELQRRDFYITETPIILSPSDFGIPQIRERVYIIGINKRIKNNDILTNGCIHLDDLQLEHEYKKCKKDAAWSILEANVPERYRILREVEEVLIAWEEFRKEVGLRTVGFPIWIHAFGLGINNDDDFKAVLNFNQAPEWKKLYLLRNRELYVNNRGFIDNWVSQHRMLDRSKLYQKFEWNCGTDVASLRDAIIQIRQSGIRAKRPTCFPSLVAMVNTPIVWDNTHGYYRYITEREAANLQNFKSSYKFASTGRIAYSQLGNSVNAKVIKILTKNLFKLAENGWRE